MAPKRGKPRPVPALAVGRWVAILAWFVVVVFVLATRGPPPTGPIGMRPPMAVGLLLLYVALSAAMLLLLAAWKRSRGFRVFDWSFLGLVLVAVVFGISMVV